jgi:hypothetical protein
VRGISPAEAVVGAEILSGSLRPVPEIGGPAVPRRTRQAVRQRFLARGSIISRYVPDPAFLGRPIVMFGLAQPYAESRATVTSAWSSNPAIANLWEFSDVVFGVFFARDAHDAQDLRARLGGDSLLRDVFFLECDARLPTVPVFFDFEGAWTRLNGLSGSMAYPQSLPCYSASAADQGTNPSEGDRETIRLMLARNEPGYRGGNGPGWLAGLSSRGQERRLIAKRAIDPRAILDPAACGRWASDFPGGIAFVRGELLGGRTAPEVFRALVESCDLRPFLLLTDGSKVLFGSLSVTNPAGTGSGTSPSNPVLPVLRNLLRQIVILRERVDSMQPLVNHRYDLPFLGTLKS